MEIKELNIYTIYENLQHQTFPMNITFPDKNYPGEYKCGEDQINAKL